MKASILTLLLTLLATVLCVAAAVCSLLGPIYWVVAAPVALFFIANSITEGVEAKAPIGYVLAMVALDVLAGVTWAGLPLVFAIARFAGLATSRKVVTKEEKL